MRLSNTVRYIILAAITIVVVGLLVLAVFKFTPIGDQPDNTAAQQQAQIEKNKKATQKSNDANKTPTTSKPSPSPKPAPTNAAPSTNPSTSSQTSSNLANSGPGDVAALFAVVVVLAGLLHHRFAFRLNK